MRLLILIVLLAGAASCSDATSEADNNPNNGNNANNANNSNVNVKDSGLDGEALYNMYCASCHGVEGAGGSVWDPSIQGHTPIHQLVVEGRGTMPPVAMSNGDIALVQQYLLSFGLEDLSGLSGEEVYDLKCANCHGDEGEGTALGYPIKFVNPELATWVIRNGRAPFEFESAMPAYPETQITTDQINQMIIYLHSGERPRDGRGLYIAFCSNCHGVDALGGYSDKKVASRSEAMEIVREGKGSDISRRSLYMPGWEVSHLIDEEVRLIEAYMGSLEDE